MKNYEIWFAGDKISEHTTLEEMLNAFDDLPDITKKYCKMYDDARRMSIYGNEYLNELPWTKECHYKNDVWTCKCKIISSEEFKQIVKDKNKPITDILSEHFKSSVVDYIRIPEENTVYVVFSNDEKVSKLEQNICDSLHHYDSEHIDISLRSKLFAQVIYHSDNNSFPIGDELLIEDENIAKYIADKYGIGYCRE